MIIYKHFNCDQREDGGHLRIYERGSMSTAHTPPQDTDINIYFKLYALVYNTFYL